MRAPLRTTLVPVLALALLTSGCLFTVKHELPPNVYFGKLPHSSGERRKNFEDKGMKNWLLAGLVPYSGWGSKDLLPKRPSVDRIENLSIETRFSALDTLIWVVPGFFYGYYIWAPRSIYVTGTQVEKTQARR
ncbi:MAG: hypothetical protein ACE5FG_09675 [Myxococcota bacterium]